MTPESEAIHPMKYQTSSSSIKICLLLTSILTLTSCDHQTKITEQNIAETLAKVDNDIANKDVNGMISNISNNAKIEFKDTASGKSMSFTKETYRKHLEEVFRDITDYKATRTNTKIIIALNGESATGEDIMNETETVNGKLVATSASQSAVFGLENGKVVITAIKGSTIITK